MRTLFDPPSLHEPRATSILDYIFRELAVSYLRRGDLATDQVDETSID